MVVRAGSEYSLSPVFLCPNPDIIDRFKPHLMGWLCLTDVPNGGEPPLTVRWNHSDGDDKGVVLNPAQAVRAAANEETVAEIWSLYRLPFHLPLTLGAHQTSKSTPNIYLTYRVYLFNLHPIGIWPVDRSSAGGPVLRRVRSSLYNLAQRALYVLGLHCGSVDIRIQKKNSRSLRPRLSLVGISCGPDVPSQMAASIATALRRTYEWFQSREPEQRGAVTLGADPEFLIVNSGRATKVISATRLFPPYTALGSDSVAGRPGRPLGEIRPTPSQSPLQLFHSVRVLLGRAQQRLRRTPYVLRSGSCPVPGFPTGGHVHFGAIGPTATTLKVLDTFLSIPVFLLEDTAPSAMRKQLGYGTWGDFRYQSHGGFEYRTLSSWLAHPRVALAVICLARTVILERRALWAHIPNSLCTPFAHKDFLNSRKERFYKLFPVLWTALQQTETFRRYEPELQYVEQSIRACRTWNEQLSISKTWNLA